MVKKAINSVLLLYKIPIRLIISAWICFSHNLNCISNDPNVFLLTTHIFQNWNGYFPCKINYALKYPCILDSETKRIKACLHNSDNVFISRQIQITIITQAHAWVSNLMYLYIRYSAHQKLLLFIRGQKCLHAY